MKKFIFNFFTLFIGSLLFSACGKNESTVKNEDAERLFNESVKVISYFDSRIKMAKDSTEMDSLFNQYEKQITDLNFSVAPQTDFKLSEEENDSLFKLMEQLVATKNEKLRMLSRNNRDTI